METLKDLFHETLKDVYFAEKAALKAMPKMAKKTKEPELRQAFEEHTEMTKGQVERLENVFKLLGKKAQGKECPALKGLIEETEELMSEAKTPEVMHAGLIGCAQAIEHYEISRYGTMCAWAEQLDMPEAVELLEATLQEEKLTDEKLTALAQSINEQADMSSDDDEYHEDEEEKGAQKKQPVRASAASQKSKTGGKNGEKGKRASR